MDFRLKRQNIQPLMTLCWLGFMLLSCVSSAVEVEKAEPLAQPLNVNAIGHPAILEPNERHPAPFSLNSLKSTSNVVLTEKDFSAWWAQIAAQNFGQESSATLETRAENTSKDQLPANFYPVSHSPSLRATAQWLEYRLKPGDVISLQVLSHPEFSLKNILIAPDGTVALPLLGKVPVSNSSIETLNELLTQGFAKSLRHPEITVSLDKIAPQRVYILGAVKKPGLYLLDGQDSALITAAGLNSPRLDYHLSTAIVKAGGVLADADLAHVKVFNLNKGFCAEANLIELLAYGALSNDISLQLDDVVYIPRLEDIQWNHPEVLKLLANSNLGQDTYPIRVYGYVARPDVYQLSPTEMTLQSVLAKAGIDIDKAQPKHIIVARALPNQQLLALKVDATRKDMILFPNDSVIVSKSNWKHWTKSVFGAASAITMPAANIKYILDGNNVITP